MPLHAEPSSASTQPKGDILLPYFLVFRVHFEFFNPFPLPPCSSVGSFAVLYGKKKKKQKKKGGGVLYMCFGVGVYLGVYFGVLESKLPGQEEQWGRDVRYSIFLSNIHICCRR